MNPFERHGIDHLSPSSLNLARNNLALWLCPILSPKAMAEHKDQIVRNPVGTGPFKFGKWVKDDHIVDYRLRTDDHKRRTVEALQSLNFHVTAGGDSFNDLSMLLGLWGTCP